MVQVLRKRYRPEERLGETELRPLALPRVQQAIPHGRAAVELPDQIFDTGQSSRWWI